MSQRVSIVYGIVATFLILPALAPTAQAQHFGIGGQAAWFKAADADSSSLMAGVHIRMKWGSFLALEGAVDYRKDTYLEQTVEVKFYPVMGSLIVFILPRGPLNPYLLGGIGYYFTTIQLQSGESDTQREFGYHLGAGLNVSVSPNLAVFGEFRYLQVDIQWSRENLDLGANGSSLRAGLTLYF